MLYQQDFCILYGKARRSVFGAIVHNGDLSIWVRPCTGQCLLTPRQCIKRGDVSSLGATFKETKAAWFPLPSSLG